MSSSSTSRDVVYFLKRDLPLGGAELRYSLRSLQNLPHNNVWLVAPQVPDWVQNVKWVPWTQLGHIYLDLSEKYKALAAYQGDMTDDVYVMDDDIYVIKPREEVPLYSQSPLIHLLNVRYDDMSDQFGRSAWATYRLMQRLGWDNLMHPCQHAPYPLTRSNIPVHLDDGGDTYEYKIFYYNWHLRQGGEVADMMYKDPKGYDYSTVINIVNRGDGLLSSLEGRHEAVFSVLKGRFPDKGQYEAD